MHLVQLFIRSDDKIQMDIIRLSGMPVIGIVTKILRERIREHVLDGGDYCLEIVLARNKTAQVVAINADDLVIAVIIGIELQ